MGLLQLLCHYAVLLLFEFSCLFLRGSHSGVALLRIELMVGLLFSQYALHEFGAEPLLCSGQQLAAKVCEEFAGCPMTLVTEFICNVDLLVPQSLCGYDL